MDDCKIQGGTLKSVGTLIDACLSSEIPKAKDLLRSAMSGTTDSKRQPFARINLGTVHATLHAYSHGARFDCASDVRAASV